MNGFQKISTETKIDIDKIMLESVISVSNAEIMFLESGDSDTFIDSIKKAIKNVFNKIKISIENFTKKLLSANIQDKFEIVINKLKDQNEKISLDSDYSKMITEYRREVDALNAYFLLLHAKIPIDAEINATAERYEDKIEKLRNTRVEVSPAIILADVKGTNAYIKIVTDTWDDAYKALTKDIEKIYKYDFDSDAESISEKKRIHMKIVKMSSTIVSSIMSTISKYYSDIISKCK